jgi:hypothetical protein
MVLLLLLVSENLMFPTLMLIRGIVGSSLTNFREFESMSLEVIANFRISRWRLSQSWISLNSVFVIFRLCNLVRRSSPDVRV